MSRTVRIHPLVFALGFVIPTGIAQAQRPQPPSSVECGTPAGGVVQGVVKSAETGTPRLLMRVALQPGGCGMSSRAQGVFELRGVAPGSYTVNILNTTEREFDPVSITIGAGDTVQLELSVRVMDALAHCKDAEMCVNLVTGHSLASARLTREQQLREIAYRTAIALGLKASVSPMPNWYACISEEDPAVFAAVKARHSRTVPRDACTSRLLPGERRERMVLAASDEPAMGAGIDRIREDGRTTRTVSLSYSVGPLWAAAWDCQFELRTNRWEPVKCVMTMVS